MDYLPLVMIVPLAKLVVSDFRHREIPVLWLGILALGTVCIPVIQDGWQEVVRRIWQNLLIVVYMSAGVFLWGSVKARKAINPIDRYIGLGDFLFFLVVIPLFTLMEYAYFLLICMSFSLVWWWVGILFGWKSKNIPLIATSGIVLAAATYDKNGNILSLMRSSATGSIMDGFRYEYNGNQLTKLYLDWEDDSDFMTYDYDANGNCTVDGSNNLNLTYNCLNLIGNVTQDNATLANYVYLADGTKVSATNSSGDGLVYAGSLVYSKQGNNLSLESTGFSGGRLVATSNDYEVRYFLTDHLESTRVVVNSAGVVFERNDFMPFGLAWSDANRPVSDNRYLYNGKEEQEFVGIPYTDFGARMYDPKYRLSWNGVDPLSEKYYSISP